MFRNATALLLLLGLCRPAAGQAERRTITLDGTWEVDESLSATDRPAAFRHKVQVPGLTNQSQPPFPDVDLFDSKELISNRIRSGRLPESARVNSAGVSRQNRNFFWYRKTFRAPARRDVAFLRVNKAQFGTAVWLNGSGLGEYPGCFSAGVFNLTAAVRWNAENTLLIRIGAHPGVLPESYPAGTDFEKLKWTPGIYDSVSVFFTSNPVIESVQVAPRPASSEIEVQTKLRNYGGAVRVSLRQGVKPRSGGKVSAEAREPEFDLEAGEERTLTQRFTLLSAHLWTPEDPFLYQLETTAGGDSLSTRFGMRDFHFDSATGKAYLNGRPYYLRGSNITLHRFFEDPDCGNRPWDEGWVRKLLVEIPKKMHWNTFRFCIGPAPDRWLEIADEGGLLVQNEFFIWTGAPDWDKGYSRKWDVKEMIRQYSDWMRDNWNHPSLVVWDANNESLDEVFGKEIIPAVRPLDLSNRPWENSYNEPAGPDDPVEYHPYQFQRDGTTDERRFRMSDLESRDPSPRGSSLPKGKRATVINEYGWVWLNRDGSPTLLTEKLYPKLLGPKSTAGERFAMNAYILAGKTEYWRASRLYAGILHFVYLTCSYPGVYTSDHFTDVGKLSLDPHFADYVSEAFKPLGVYLRFFQETLTAGEERKFAVSLVNDERNSLRGKIVLSLHDGKDAQVSRGEAPFEIGELGQTTVEIPLSVPRVAGKHTLKATAIPTGRHETTVSRRWVTVGAAKR
jgi:beta-galactosidase